MAARTVVVARGVEMIPTESTIPPEIERLVFGLDDTSGQYQPLSAEEVLVRLIRRRA